MSDPMDVWFPRFMFAAIGCVLGGMLMAFLLVALPRLLIEAHAAWSAVFVTWGIR